LPQSGIPLFAQLRQHRAEVARGTAATAMEA
jgi:hypothetical protein